MWRTTEFWRQWINSGDFPDHPWRSYHAAQRADVEGPDIRAHRGAVGGAYHVAAGNSQGERNWDYRYAWVRDSTFALWGLYTLGLDREADDFFSFIRDVGCNGDEPTCR